jgi:hypothetical protein
VGIRILFSYETPCAVYVPREGFKRLDESVSRTTDRHIAEWVNGNPVTPISLAEMCAYVIASIEKRETLNE